MSNQSDRHPPHPPVYLIEYGLHDDKPRRFWPIKSKAEDDREVFIGRSPEHCEIVLDNLNVSRCHAKVSCTTTPHSVQLTDLTTRNGTTLNGVKLVGAVIIDCRKSGRIQFADCPMVYRFQLEQPQITGSVRISSSSLIDMVSPPVACVSEEPSPLQEVPPAIHGMASAKASPPSDSRSKSAAAVSPPTPVEARSSSELKEVPPLSKSNVGTQAKPEKKRTFRSRWDPPPPEFEDGDRGGPSCGLELPSSGRTVQQMRLEAEQRAVEISTSLLAAAAATSSSNAMSVKEKRKLLWSKKGSSDAEVGGSGRGSNDGVEVEDPNEYGKSFSSDFSKKNKFLKLMGFKKVENTNECPPPDAHASSDISTHKRSGSDMEVELEHQFIQGLRRVDGRKTGLGL